MNATSCEPRIQNSGVRMLGFVAAPTPLRDQARQRLQESPYACLRRVRCECHEGVVTLHGRVASYFLKQMAQEAVRRLAGAEEIANRIEVVEEWAE